LIAFNSSDGSISWDHGDCPGGENSSPHPPKIPALDETANSVYFGSTYLCSVVMDSGVNNWSKSGGSYIGSIGEGKLNTAIRQPSHHESTTSENSLWGDDTGERMNSYAGQFADGVHQAPFYADTPSGKYETDGSTSEPIGGWGSNVPDYVTFCMDCHQDAIGDIPALDWDNNPHGGKMFSTSALKAPYTDPNKNHVISCLDCHEAHGAKQEPYLFRRMVNGQEIPLGGSVCSACHDMGETSKTEGKDKRLSFDGRVHK
jgi:hypothetical protein